MPPKGSPTKSQPLRFSPGTGAQVSPVGLPRAASPGPGHKPAKNRGKQPKDDGKKRKRKPKRTMKSYASKMIKSSAPSANVDSGTKEVVASMMTQTNNSLVNSMDYILNTTGKSTRTERTALAAIKLEFKGDLLAAVLKRALEVRDLTVAGKKSGGVRKKKASKQRR